VSLINGFFGSPFAGSGSFTPTSFSGLAVWLDGDDIATITKDGSDRVSQWNDKSGNGNNATAAGGARPTYASAGMNSKPTLGFTASQSMNVADSATLDYSKISVFVVYRRDTDTGTTQTFIHKYASASTKEWQLQVATDDSFLFNASVDGSATSVAKNTGIPATVANPYIIDFKYDGGGCTFRANNGTASYNTLASVFNGTSVLTIGRNTSSDGRCSISEVIIYNRLLSATQRAEVLNYLATKWAITIATPVIAQVHSLFGQSNMVGNGVTTSASAYLQGVIAGASIYQPGTTNFGTLDSGSNNLGAAANRFGPEMAIGYYLDQALTTTPYLIKYAASAKHLANDDLTNSFYPVSGTQYDNTIAYIDSAMKYLASQGIEAEVAATLFTQGEADAGVEAYANAYQTNLALLKTNFTNAMIAKGWGRPGLRFIISEIHKEDGDLYIDTVRDAQFAVGGDDMIHTQGFPLKVDNVHYDHVGQEYLGAAYVEKIGYDTGLTIPTD
jgi:hypothetical protein